MTVLLETRTHPKILFKAFVIQIILIIFHVLAVIFWPEQIDWVFAEEWGPWITHGAIFTLELWYVAVPFLQWYNSKFIVTNDRVRSEWGVLYKHSREIKLHRIASISDERGILDRIFGAGTLNFYDAAAPAQPKTSGKWNKHAQNVGIQFKDVPNIKKVREVIEEAKTKINMNVR